VKLKEMSLGIHSYQTYYFRFSFGNSSCPVWEDNLQQLLNDIL